MRASRGVLGLQVRALGTGVVALYLLRRDLVETQLAYLDALADLVEARHSLELAVGGPVH